MSSALAIATVSALLRELLQQRMDALSESGFDKITVNALIPELVKAAPETGDHLDLFLYLVTPNTGWRNSGWPSRDSAGQPIGAPPLALDLYYLLSASSSKDLYAESMLGCALQLLHEVPVLARELIETRQSAWAKNEGGVLKQLATDPLSRQVELVKLSPEVVRADDMAKLWSGFQVKYRPCAAFGASVLLIDSIGSFASAPPVQERRVYAIAAAKPYIDSIAPAVALSGDDLSIRGQNLAATDVQVELNDVRVRPEVVNIGHLRLQVPPEVRAGLVAVQVVHNHGIGGAAKPTHPPLRLESNVAALMLRPRVDGAVPAVGGLQVQVTPRVGRGQKAQLLLDEVNPAAGHDALAWRIEAPGHNGIPDAAPDTPSILFPLAGVSAGSYFVRLQVDGGMSPLILDPASPNYGPTTSVV